MTTHSPTSGSSLAGPRDKGQEYEKLAFTFCKTATIVLLANRYALPVSAGAAIVFYLLADRHGQKESRCILRYPLLIAAFWSIVLAVWIFGTFLAMRGPVVTVQPAVKGVAVTPRLDPAP